MLAVIAIAAGAVILPADAAGVGGERKPDDLAIDRVNVLPMTEQGAVLSDVTVLIRDGRIAAIGSSESASEQPAARRVDAAGKWLLPAFADMHVHFENHRLLGIWLDDRSIRADATELAHLSAPYVANGVLQIANMSAMSESIGQRVEIEGRRVLGPRMALGAMIDGKPADWPSGMTRVAASPSDGRQAVRDALAEGYDFIKVYNRLDVPTFEAIVDEARAQRLRVAGHLIARGEGITDRLLRPGFGLVAHLQEYSHQGMTLNDAELDDLAQSTRRNGTWVVTTLSADQRIAQVLRHDAAMSQWPRCQYVHPLIHRYWTRSNPLLRDRSAQRVARFERIAADSARVLRAMLKANVPVIAGTDYPLPLQAPGFALHDELHAMVAAGMSTSAVLQSATRLPAQWLGVHDDRGTVEVGKRANLVLLAGNPLEDISHTRSIAAVIADGRYLPRARLERMLAETAAHYVREAAGAGARCAP